MVHNSRQIDANRQAGGVGKWGDFAAPWAGAPASLFGGGHEKISCMSARLPSTTALLCCEAAARLGSFTRAAAELHLTQAAVSRQVIGLESRLGTLLFLRQREALLLTPAGSAFLDDVRPALASLERATAAVTALKGQGGPLNLSVASSLGSYWLIPRLPDFTRQHAQITLNLATRVGPADFAGGRLDASLEFGDGQRAGLHSEFVMPLRLSPYASPLWLRHHGKKLGPHTPAAALIQHSTEPQAWPRWFAQARIAPPALADGPRHDLMSMALHAAQAGLGVALLPAFMVTDALADKRLLRLSAVASSAERGYWLVLPPAALGKPSVMAFQAWLRGQAGPA
jgi:LysR family transcriptional regulator, glycine cleavage system transcriptional activator